MSLPRRLPPAEPDSDLVALFEQPDRVPKAVRRQAEFFLFFARTVFPLLETYRDRLATVYTVDNGRPAWDPVRLLGVLVLQFVLRVADRQAAELAQSDQRWRLALHLTPTEPTFEPSLLVVFRNRLVEGAQEGLAFAAVLDYLVEQGWVPKFPPTTGLDPCVGAVEPDESPGVCPRDDPPAVGRVGSRRSLPGGLDSVLGALR